MKTTNRAGLCALALLSALPACTSLERPAPERRLVAIDAAPAERAVGARSLAPEAAAFEGSVRVPGFRVSPRFAGRELVYRKGEHEWERDYYTLFFEEPAQGLAEQTRLWMGRSGLFASALDAGDRGAARWTLDGYVSQLYGDFSSAGAGTAVLAIEFHLVDDSEGAWRVVQRHELRREVALEERTVAALVSGWSAGLGEMLAELESRLRADANASAAR